MALSSERHEFLPLLPPPRRNLKRKRISLYSTGFKRSRTHKRLGRSAHPRLAQPHTHTHTYIHTIPVHLHPQRRFCSLFSHCRSTLSRRRFPLICSHASLAILLLILLTLPITNTFLHLCLSSPSHKSHTFDHPKPAHQSPHMFLFL